MSVELISRVEAHKTRLAEMKAVYGRLKAMRGEAVKRASDLARQEKDAEAAHSIIVEVLRATQEETVGLVNELVSLALAAVYGPEYSFELEFSIRRNQSEATPWVLRNGERFSPREEVGGGILDICSLALRLALWSLKVPRTAPVFILDEPAKWLSADKQAAFGRLLKEVSEKLGVQIIVVSHSRGIIECGDKTYEVRIEKGISQVELVK